MGREAFGGVRGDGIKDVDANMDEKRKTVLVMVGKEVEGGAGEGVAVCLVGHGWSLTGCGVGQTNHSELHES